MNNIFNKLKRNSAALFPALTLVLLMTAVSIQAQPTAKEWNQNVIGWNLGNQFECSAPGQDGESMEIGMYENSIKA